MVNFIFQNIRPYFDWNLATLKYLNLVQKMGNLRFWLILASKEGVVATTIQIETKLLDHPYSCSIGFRFCEKKVGQLFFLKNPARKNHATTSRIAHFGGEEIDSTFFDLWNFFLQIQDDTNFTCPIKHTFPTHIHSYCNLF